MEGFGAIVYNKVLISALLASLIAQGLKLILTLLFEKRFDFTKMIASGGMPSAHSATVCALSTAVGELYGYQSPIFGISFVLSMVVMYDASGVRRAAGKQAQVLNKIIEEMENKEFHLEERLKELLGHTPVEVFVGGILGVIITLTYLYKLS